LGLGLGLGEGAVEGLGSGGDLTVEEFGSQRDLRWEAEEVEEGGGLLWREDFGWLPPAILHGGDCKGSLPIRLNFTAGALLSLL